MPYPNVLIVGSSGSGKTRSIKNLNPDDVLIINQEQKQLPFREAKNFKNNFFVETYSNVLETLQFKVKPEHKIVVIESLQSISDQLLKESRTLNKGYDIFNWHNIRINDLLGTIKKMTEKIVVVLDLDDLYDEKNPDGSSKSYRCARVNGREKRAEIERDFEIVLFTDVMKNPDGSMNYRFLTNTDGICTAKSPEGMFQRWIPNDLKVVVDGINNYYK